MEPDGSQFSQMGKTRLYFLSGSLTLKNQKYLIEFVQNSFFCQI